MQNIKKYLLFLFLFFLKIHGNNQAIKVGLFNTSNSEKYKYQTFIDISESVGFEVDYKSISNIVDNLEKIKLNEYGAIFFIISIEFLKGIANNSTVALKLLNLFKKFSNTNKTIGLVLPVLKARGIDKTIFLNPILKAFNINRNHINHYKLNSLFIMLNKFLNEPLEARSFSYHTTLSNPKKININTHNSVNTNFMTTLPVNNLSQDPTLPYGIYWTDNNKKALFVTSSTLLSFAGISENFHFCPTNYKLRLKMLQNMQKMLQELYFFISNKKIDYNQVKKIKKEELPKSIKKTGQPIKNKDNNYYKKIAWLDIDIFEKEDKVSIQKQRKLIDNIILSGSDLTLWLTLNPQMYYSPVGKRANNKKNFIKSLSKFTKKLYLKAKAKNIIPPKILIGFEIANNLYPPNYPKKCAFDIYGNKYFDIPNPINHNFWNQEIINPLKQFLYQWKKNSISNNIKIAGIVLDLEMYCRKTSNLFLSTLGFNLDNIQKFNRKNLNDIIINKKLENYYDFLNKKAVEVGKNIKNTIKKHLPKKIIACYAPQISTNWFYKGFYKGLSSKKSPIQLLTFNSEFKTHEKWLQENKIFVKHSSVLMLSKIKSEKDFWWIDKKMKFHHGIWLNKFSRLAEKKHNNWMSIEQSKMNNKIMLKFFEKLKNKK